MVITLQLDQASQQTIASHAKAADAAQAAFREGLTAALASGSDSIAEDVQRGRLGLTPRHGGMGLAGSVQYWWVDEPGLLGALGVPSNVPAARYASIQEYGGTIFPKTAKSLAIPISTEAKQHTSPRDMAGLTLIPRPGKPPLLVRLISGGRKKDRMEVHWVLVPSVTIQGTGWFSNGVRRATAAMALAFDNVLEKWMKRWKRQ